MIVGLPLQFRSARAQVVGAQLSGSVKDVSGASVPHAQVAIVNLATGVVTKVATDEAGFFSAPNLLPGNYQVTANATGFASELRKGITLTVGEQQTLDFSLKLGTVDENVTVTDSAPPVELTSSSTGAVIGSKAVVGLPLNGRDWVQLAALNPSVHTLPEQPSATGLANRENRGIGTQLSISGTRPQQSNYRLDGVNIDDYSGGGPGSVGGVAMGVDAIAEFSVLTSNYSAEYGRTSGGVVNATTRSGANQLHGNAYWFLRDDKLDARNYFDPPQIAPFHRNQFGASIGGRLKKDKTFFFANYEGLRQNLGISNVDKVPSANARSGIIANANGTTSTITVSPAIMPYLGFFPLPNDGLIAPGNTGLYLVSTDTDTSENFETVRIDHKFSDKDSGFASWFNDRATSDGPDALNTWLIGNTSSREMFAIEETHILRPSFINTVRGGYSRIVVDGNVPVSAINPLAADTTLGSFPDTAATALTITGLTTFDGGVGGLTDLLNTWNSYQAYDDAFLSKGTHSIKFGFTFERMQLARTSVANPTGTWVFSSLTNFLINQPTSLKAQVPGTGSSRGLRQSIFGGYIQDDWHLRSNLTVNMGLRYEMATVPTDVHNQLANLPTLSSPSPVLGSPLFQNPTLRNFEPRLGLAYDPFGDGKTSIRAAFGLFDVLPLLYEFEFAQGASAPYSVVLSEANLPANSFPTLDTSNIQSSELIFAYNPSKPPRNYLMGWNLNIERQLTRELSMEVGYIGNRGIHMVDRADDADVVLPAQTSEGYLWPKTPGTRLNPNVGSIRAMDWQGDSYYDALEAKVTQAVTHGLQVQGSYTWGKNIDTGSSSGFGAQFNNSISSLFLFCQACRRGLADFNIGQALSANYMWDIPIPKKWAPAARYPLGGWQLGGIITAETGVPLTFRISGDPLGLRSTDAYDFPDRSVSGGCSTPVNPGSVSNYLKLNCFTLPVATPDIAANCVAYSTSPGTCKNLVGNEGRNSVVGPGLTTWDLSIFKNTHVPKLGETFNAQFRAEFFNVLNHSNFLPPVDNDTLFTNTGAPVAGAGAIDATSTTSRQIQFGLKLMW
jgi:hypothetical protein